MSVCLGQGQLRDKDYQLAGRNGKSGSFRWALLVQCIEDGRDGPSGTDTFRKLSYLGCQSQVLLGSLGTWTVRDRYC